MACTSGKVQKVADKTLEAKAQIDKLQKMMMDQDAEHKATFLASIKTHLDNAKVKDAREISYNSAIKTEYTSEFSLDKIAAVVTSSLKALQAAKDPSIGSPATSPAAIAAYADVVNVVAEAAKSKSTAAASLSFSMNRLSPGMFAFLYATSVNIKDEDTFGSEAVTSTAIYYQFMQSIDDVKNEATFGAAIIDAKNLLQMKTLQAALIEGLTRPKPDTISISDWMEQDAAYSKAIAVIQKRLDDAKFNTANSFVMDEAQGFGASVSHSFVSGSAESQQVVRAAIKKLSAMGDAYKTVIEISEARLASVYY